MKIYYSSIFLVLHIAIRLQVSLEWIPYAEFLKIWKGCRWPASSQTPHTIFVFLQHESYCLSTGSTTTLRHAFGGSTPAIFNHKSFLHLGHQIFLKPTYTHHILVFKTWLKGTTVKADGSQRCKDKSWKTSTTMNLKLPAEHFQLMPLQ